MKIIKCCYFLERSKNKKRSERAGAPESPRGPHTSPGPHTSNIIQLFLFSSLLLDCFFFFWYCVALWLFDLKIKMLVDGGSFRLSSIHMTSPSYHHLIRNFQLRASMIYVVNQNPPFNFFKKLFSIL